jgi:hypothetical protein
MWLFRSIIILGSIYEVVLTTWGLGEGLTTPVKTQVVTNCYTGPRNWWSLVNTVMGFQDS